MRLSDYLRRDAGYLQIILIDPWNRRSLVWSSVIILFTISIYQNFFVALPHYDVAWLLTASERMLSGGTYLNDFFEVNWPMAIMIYCPGVVLAHYFNIDLYTGFLIYFFVILGGSVSATGYLLRLLISNMPAIAGLLTVAYAWIVLLLPHTMFGQREHFLVVLYLPFVIAAAGHTACVPVQSRFFRSGISVAAAIGVFIKPHFILLPCAIFVMRYLKERSWRFLLCFDFITFLILGIAYILVTLVIFSEWYTVAKLAIEFYSAWDGDRTRLLQLGGIGFALAIIILIANRYVGLPQNIKEMILYLALTAAIASLIFIIQKKGWTYHLIPAASALIFVGLGFTSALLASVKRLQSPHRKVVTVLSTLVILILASIPIIQSLRLDHQRLENYRKIPILKTIRETKPRSSVFVFSSHIGGGFPWVMLENMSWASRFPCLWMIPGLANQLSETKTTSERKHLLSLRHNVVEMILADFRRYNPSVVIVRVKPLQTIFKNNFNFLTFFRANPSFEKVWLNYRFLGHFGNYDLYLRSDKRQIY